MLGSQFSRPHGAAGKLAGWFMSKENEELNEWTLSFLNMKDNEHVLEVGFGPGSAIKQLLKSNQVKVLAIDPSEAMVETTIRRLGKLPFLEQVCIVHGEAALIEQFNLTFDKVYSINNVTYWKNPVETLRFLKQHMKPNGRIALTLCPHEKGATDDTTEVLSGQLTSMLQKSGFRNIEAFVKPTKPNDTVCAVAMS
ncbi:class I SAM-dependent methyltransferase [Halobacillus salinarum]|uniref:Class I SAM-dependent methyltransferase n=1 Tax=Halobacillus salinarum TaxID=2932257 RepID=A0ABY4EIR3_9BACI|nr:class I SAM-dependent methyltransferase [Halobacillus salinarum]UOQ44376.1 class I SAM-dependent methyltransferase [Halobacillus salinarum]